MIEEYRPNFVMMIGLPGSGKSTQVEKFIDSDCQNYEIISNDRLIEELARKNNVDYEYVIDNIDKKIITREMYRRLEKAKEERKNILFDRTNLTSGARIKFIRMFTYIYNIIGIHMITDIDTILARNEYREDKRLPHDILYNMIGSYEEPEVWEGFDLITEIKS